MHTQSTCILVLLALSTQNAQAQNSHVYLNDGSNASNRLVINSIRPFRSNVSILDWDRLYSSLEKANVSLAWTENELEMNHTDFTPPSGRNDYSEALLTFARILYALVCIVGLCGNTLVIYVVLRFSKMQTVTNMYILNLAMADEMFLVGLPFLVITLTYRYWAFGWLMCKVYMTITSINQFTSSLLLTVMSADR